MCEVCETFNPFAGNWLHDDSVGDGGGLSTTQGDELPVLEMDEIADRLAFAPWEIHNGNGWSFNGVNLAQANPKHLTYNISALQDHGKWFADQAMESWAATTGLEFTKVNGSADITFNHNSGGATTQNAGAVNGAATDYWLTASTVKVVEDWGNDTQHYMFGVTELKTYIHEAGHAFGLAHPAPYNSSADYPDDAEFANDSWQATVMSYFDQKENTFIDLDIAFPMTPMPADILALQALHGVDGDLRTENSTYGVGSDTGDYYDNLEGNWGNSAFTIVDDGGWDLIDFSDTTEDQIVDLAPGSFSSVGGLRGNMAILEGTVIEKFRSGAGNDIIDGNTAKNTINAGAGDDTVSGLSGKDRLNGEGGHDDISGGRAKDIISGGSGDDTIRGGLGKDVLSGNEDNDEIRGEGGRDTIKGGWGDDKLYGGGDQDTILGSDGMDRLAGEWGDDDLQGENGSDTLFGGSGNDTLDGGRGSDSLTGGGDMDTFVYKDNYGTDIIHDWQPGVDKVDVSDFGLIDFTAVEALFHGHDLGVALKFSKFGLLVFKDMGQDDLLEADFLF